MNGATHPAPSAIYPGSFDPLTLGHLDVIERASNAIERDVLPTTQRYGMGVLPWSPLAGGWLSGAFGAGKANVSRRAERIPARYDLSIPGNQRKLDLVIELSTLADEAGITLIDLALAFVLEHPGVSSAITSRTTVPASMRSRRFDPSPDSYFETSKSVSARRCNSSFDLIDCSRIVR